jgi:IS4 transposase
MASGWALPGAYYVMDRGYVDYARLAHLAARGAFFVIRAINSMRFERLESTALDDMAIQAGVQADDVGHLTRPTSRQRYAQPLRRVTLQDELGRELVLLTNQFELGAHTVAALYKKRWQVELFFKWIKQHLRIKSFLGTSANAVKTQIWIALSVYLMCAIANKRLGLHAHSLHDMLRVIELNLFEPLPITDLLNRLATEPSDDSSLQIELF